VADYGGKGAEELAGDVSHDGTAGGDSVLCEEDDGTGEEVVDFKGAEEILDGIDEFGREVFGGAILSEAAVFRAKGSAGRGNERAAASDAGVVLAAT